MADPSACLDRYLGPARKIFNFGKRKKSQGAWSGEGVVKLLPSLFEEKKKLNIWAGELSYGSLTYLKPVTGQGF